MPVDGIASVSELWRRLDDNPSLRAICGFREDSPLPSVDTFRRVRRNMEAMPEIVESRIEEMIGHMTEYLPDLGKEVAVDATVIRSNSNGNRDPVSDPDAAWGIGNKAGARSGKDWVFGYKLLVAADANCDAPLYMRVVPANESEMSGFISFMDNFLARGFKPEVVIADRGYDSMENSEWLQERGIAPVIHKRRPQNNKHTRKWYKPGFAPDGTPLCGCGIARPYLRTDPDTGEHVYGARPDGCVNLFGPDQPALGDMGPCGVETRIDPTLDVRLFGGAIRRGSDEWNAAYRKRWSVERVFSRWKGRGRINDHCLRGWSCVNRLTQLHMLSLLSSKLIELKAEARASIPLAA